MKKYLLGLILIPLVFAACSKNKESRCVKGRIIGINPCSQSWGVQIIDGPKIGTQSGIYDNVIELFDVPFDSKGSDAIIYFTYSKKKPQPSRPCITILPMPDFSPVDKSLASLSDVACP